MPITHVVVKVPGNTLAAVADWNANHAISAGTILRSATLIVAASDSLDTTNADYFCDGVADEVQINAAIDALPATGGCVCLMDGTFDIDTSILIDVNNTSLVGQGKSTKITSANNITFITTSVDDLDGIMIANLYLEGSGAVSGSLIGIDFHVFHSLISNVWLKDFYLGISRIEEDFNIVEGCFFKDIGSKGIEIFAGLFNIIIGNTFNDCDPGIRCTSYQNTITGNIFSACSIGINIGGSTNTVTGNVGYACTEFIYVESFDYNSIVGNTSIYGNYGVRVRNSKNNTIIGNSSWRTNTHAIYLENADECVVDGNTTYEIYGTHAIYVNSSDHCTISNNTLTKIDQDGIRLNASNHNIITGNNIHDCSEDTNNTYSGIFLTGTSTYNVVSNNRISGDAANKHQYGIREAAAADDWNCVTGNICTDAITANISLQGVNDEEAHNIAP